MSELIYMWKYLRKETCLYFNDNTTAAKMLCKDRQKSSLDLSVDNPIKHIAKF